MDPPPLPPSPKWVKARLVAHPCPISIEWHAVPGDEPRSTGDEPRSTGDKPRTSTSPADAYPRTVHKTRFLRLPHDRDDDWFPPWRISIYLAPVLAYLWSAWNLGIIKF